MKQEEINILEKAFSADHAGKIYPYICDISRNLAARGYLERKLGGYRLTFNGNVCVRCKQCGKKVKGPYYTRAGSDGLAYKLHVECLDEWINSPQKR